MRNRLIFAPFASLLVGCLCCSATADPVPSAIKARYKSLVSVIERVDLKAFDSYFARDYVSIDPAGKSSDRAAYLAGMRELMRGAKRARLNLRCSSAKIHGDTVEVSFDCTGKIVTAKGTSGFHEAGTDTWKKIGADWKQIKTIDTVMNVTTPKAKRM